MADVGALQGVSKQRLRSILRPSVRNPYLETVINQPRGTPGSSTGASIGMPLGLMFIIFLIGILVGVGICMLVYYSKLKK